MNIGVFVLSGAVSKGIEVAQSEQSITFSILLGAVSSLVASLVFLFCLSRFRPHLEISQFISQCEDNEKNVRFAIKIINRTKSEVVNVRARLYIVYPQTVHGGTIGITRYLKLKTDDILEIKRFDLKDREADYAVRFVTFEDLDVLWQEDGASYVRFQVYAVHSLTGFGRTFTKSYHSKVTCLKKGNFTFGNSVEILQ